MGASVGRLRREDEEALVQAAIGTNRRCQDDVSKLNVKKKDEVQRKDERFGLEG